ncbi:protein Wnt-10a-like [Tubulanus polymorphus]|uniref:protein Wnt-10a-like n=1 Tax=Tubulanus polymorphus TaxID=672921 RepID=UPI003DA44373
MVACLYSGYSDGRIRHNSHHRKERLRKPQAYNSNNYIRGRQQQQQLTNRADENIICKNYPDISHSQYSLCLNYPGVTAAAIYGIRYSINECKYQFKKYRWDCASLMRKNPHESEFLRKGFREGAFAYAIMAAGIVTNVARLCSSGKLLSCTCDMTMRGKTKEFQWGGCSHNTHFGSYFSQKFLESTGHKDLHSRIAHHNNGAGRLAVMNNVRTNCKCHGMSGSCEIKTCWKASPTFHDVGRELLGKYNEAIQVTNSNSANGGFEPVVKTAENSKPYLTDLVYLEKSPSFCDADPTMGIRGTSGRNCNATSAGTDNCVTMCCGRGYNTVKVTRKERCHCKFQYCCKVICKICTKVEWITTCK